VSYDPANRWAALILSILPGAQSRGAEKNTKKGRTEEQKNRKEQRKKEGQ
jgi:hypothetical protein